MSNEPNKTLRILNATCATIHAGFCAMWIKKNG